MKVNITKLPKSEIELKIEVPPEEWHEFVEEAAKELSRDLKIAGFRPGYVPLKLVEEKIGTAKILEQAAHHCVQKSYVRAILDNNIEAIGKPEISVLKIPAPYRTEGSGSGAKDNPFEFKAKVAVMPEVELTDYIKIAKEKKPKKKEEILVEDKEVEESLEGLQKSRAKYMTVKREAQPGDRIEIDFETKINGVKITNGESKNHPFILGQGRFVSGFEEKIKGMKEREEKEFSLLFPSDYYKKDLADKLVDFKVKMNLVQEQELPELDDQFAQGLGNFNNLENLRQSIKEGIGQEKEEEEKEKWRLELVSKIAEQSVMEIPDILIEEELKKMIFDFKIQIEQFGLDWSQYLTETKKTEDELKKDWREQAIKRVRIGLVLREIAEKEKIEVEENELAEEVNKFLNHYSGKLVEKNVDIEQLKEYTYGVIKNKKVFQLLEKL